MGGSIALILEIKTIFSLRSKNLKIGGATHPIE